MHINRLVLYGKANGFLVFRDKSVENMRARNIKQEAVKLYIPTNKDNIQDLAQKLFDYLLNRDIMHETKISNDIRSDDIVTRVYDEKCVKKIIDFINENLSDKVIQTNPFVMRDGVVGIARDGDLSYNERVSGFLGEYLSQNQENMDNVNLDSFRQFMQSLKDRIVTDKEYISKILSKKNKAYNRVSHLDYIYDNKNIIDLILLSLDKEKGLEDFTKYWQSIKDKQVEEKIKQKIADILNELQKEDTKDTKKEVPKTPIQRKIGKTKKVKEEKKKISFKKHTPVQKILEDDTSKVEKKVEGEKMMEDNTELEETTQQEDIEKSKRFMSVDEYDKEFSKTGEKNFYAFLDKKKQNAIDNEDLELAEHIEKIYEQAVREQEEYDEMARYEEDKKRKKDYDLRDETEDFEWFYDEETNDEYDKNGYNRDGFNKEGIHKDTLNRYSPLGYDKNGFDREGHNEYGETREEAAKSWDILDAEIKRQYRIKENGFDPDEELEDYNYSEKEQQDGVEINEFGEIIRPDKKETPKSLDDMTPKELMKAIAENDEVIENNNNIIKQALMERLLEQQKIIDEQQVEIDRLKSQKEL